VTTNRGQKNGVGNILAHVSRRELLASLALMALCLVTPLKPLFVWWPMDTLASNYHGVLGQCVS
ncbi:hypothetical protein PQQ64_04915, partial [Paraburkholderia graminis]|uniref:hypothetical protein n=1 Tax=Paraburkholderia graminis TaxID=60548 RepID=UPI0038B8908A